MAMIAHAQTGLQETRRPDRRQPERLTLAPWSVTRVLLAITAGFTLLDLVGQFAKYVWGI